MGQALLVKSKIKFKKSWVFQKFQSHYPRLWIQDHIRNKTLGIHFQVSDPIFFFSLSRIQGVLRPCSKRYTIRLQRYCTKGRYRAHINNLRSQTLHILCLYNYQNNYWHHLRILQLVWTFLMSVSSRCKSFFSWTFTYMNIYLLTTLNWVKQLIFCMIGSFVISNKVVWRFNGETFVKQSVKLLTLVKLLYLKFHYQKSGH